MSRFPLACACALAAIACCTVRADDSKEPTAPSDLPMPLSPAAAALGTADAAILKPATAKDLAASLIRVAGRNGKVTSGVSMEFAPMVLATGSRYIDGYGNGVAREKSLAARRTIWKPLLQGGISPAWILANTTLSLATGAKEGSGSSTDRISVGLKVPIFDEGDPRLNVALISCYKAIDAAHSVVLLPPSPVPPPSEATVEQKKKYAEELKKWKETVAAEDEKIKPLYSACLENNGKAAWNASSAAFAFAQAWTDTGTADQSHLARDSRYGWFSYASDLGSRDGDRQMQLVLQAAMTRNAIDTTKSTDGSDPIRYNGNAGALRFKLGEEKRNVDIAASVERRRYSDGKSEYVKLAALGYEFQIMTDLWLKISMGSERRELTGSNPFVNTSIKWGTNKAADLTPAGMKKAVPD